jgi:hypothetical protein
MNFDPSIDLTDDILSAGQISDTDAVDRMRSRGLSKSGKT